MDRPWDISIRTDPEGQNVYGPSLATVEDIVIEPCESGGTSTKHVTSLGISKATHEFLTLRYFALDSAEWWEQILGELLPNAQFPAAVIRRTIAYQMFMAAHIAPSHRRPPHQCGKIPSVSLLIYCLEMEWTATWVQCNELILLWR